MRSPRLEEQSEKDFLDDAKFVIQDIGNWIKNADAKSTVIAAATGVVATASVSNAGVVYSALKNGEFHCKWLLIGVTATVLISVVVTGFYLFRALSPRTTHRGTTNRFAWPSLASNAVMLPMDRSWDTVHKEAWQQVEALAEIAKGKFSSFRIALRWFGTGFVASLCMIGLATWNSKP